MREMSASNDCKRLVKVAGGVRHVKQVSPWLVVLRACYLSIRWPCPSVNWQLLFWSITL